MIEGIVTHINADATEPQVQQKSENSPPSANGQLVYRALITLKSQFLEAHERRYLLTPGMQVAAEINLGNRSVIVYLLSPVQKTVSEAGRER